MTQITIAIVGAGLIGRRHAALVQSLKNCALSAVADPSPQGRDVAHAYGVPHFVTLEEMLSSARPDGIIIATPNHLHVEHGLACVAAGVPALIEKPVAESLDRGLELLNAAERAGSKILVGHHRRYSSIIAKSVEIIRAGALGRLTSIVATELLYKPDDYFEGESSWRTRLGGGPILINLIHDIGNLRALAGEITELHAFCSNATREYEVEDSAAISLRFENGALGTIMLSDTAVSDKSWEHTSGEDLDNFDRAHVDDVDCYLIAGTHGSLGIPTMQFRRFSKGVERSWLNPLERSTLDVTVDDPLSAQLAHFCDVIQGQAEPLVSLRDGLANLSVVEAIQKSSSEAQPVEVPTF